ncbi:MAG: hypothetical protein A3H35_19275 [Betaproteobacteria bacterium RIFCSPLOWO2_02_FULL_62_17]|nr:MAG: hypothetical protein A3H35_19275 [Betaproteobacteria bacterium RIFCSPLOWO2_02_FULL_62_17]
MKVLVTGAGLVGCNVARLLRERGHEAILYDRAPDQAYIDSVAKSVPVVTADVQELSALIETLQAHDVDTIVHSAYQIGGSLRARPYAGVRANVDGCLALVEAARLCKVRRFLFTSSFGIYDWNRLPRAPLTEDFPLAGDNPYIASKIACEKLLESLAKSYGLEFAILRLAQVYGRGHYLGGDFAGGAVHEAIALALSGNPARIDPGVLTVNDYVYAKDVGQGVVRACEKPLNHLIYNIGSGVLASTQDVAAAIQKAVPGAKVEILARPLIGPIWRHEQMLDLDRSRKELGYRPRFDLADGVADFAAELAAGRVPPP